MAEFTDNVVVVTGAGRGIGAAIAHAFAAAGAKVAIAELNRDLGAATAEAIRATGGVAQSHQLDVSVPASVTRCFAEILRDFSRFDVLVNNAGVAPIGPSVEFADEDWQQAISVLLNGVFYCSKAAGRVMLAQRSGVIVNISSIGALGGWPRRAAYNAAKAGVSSLTETLGTEWLPSGVRVVAVAPGVTRTDMVRQAVSAGIADMGNYERRTPLGRLAEVDEIAQAVLFLASPRARALNACTVRVDGGWVPWGNLP